MSIPVNQKDRVQQKQMRDSPLDVAERGHKISMKTAEKIRRFLVRLLATFLNQAFRLRLFYGLFWPF
jgi:hypothetical protein